MSGLANVIASVETSSDKTSFPDFPAENPERQELKEWLDVFKDDLVTVGFGPILRGESPRECVKLVDRTLLPVPADPAAAVRLLMLRMSRSTRSTRRMSLNVSP